MENKKSYYAIIPANVRYAKIPDKAKLLYGEITALCNEKGYCWASNNYFAQLYDVHKNTISRLISILAKNEFIEIELIKKDGKEVLRKMFIGIRKNEVGYTQNCLGGIREIAEENITMNNTINTHAFEKASQNEKIKNAVENISEKKGDRISSGIENSLVDNFPPDDELSFSEKKRVPVETIRQYKEEYTLWILANPQDKKHHNRSMAHCVKMWINRDITSGKLKQEPKKLTQEERDWEFRREAVLAWGNEDDKKAFFQEDERRKAKNAK